MTPQNAGTSAAHQGGDAVKGGAKKVARTGFNGAKAAGKKAALAAATGGGSAAVDAGRAGLGAAKKGQRLAKGAKKAAPKAGQGKNGSAGGKGNLADKGTHGGWGANARKAIAAKESGASQQGSEGLKQKAQRLRQSKGGKAAETVLAATPAGAPIKAVATGIRVAKVAVPIGLAVLLFGFMLFGIGGGAAGANSSITNFGTGVGEITAVNDDDVNKLAPALNIPPVSLKAYIMGASAVKTRGAVNPNIAGCTMRWQLIGANGAQESGHGTFNGNPPYFDDEGTTLSPILNPSGAQGVFQFMPGTWSGFAGTYNLDMNNDGVEVVDNVYDQALASGLHLCRNYPLDYATASAVSDQEMTATFLDYCGGCSGAPERTQWVHDRDQYTTCIVSQVDEECGSGTSCSDITAEVHTGSMAPCSIRVVQSVGFGGVGVVMNGFACPVVKSDAGGPSYSDTYGMPWGDHLHKGIDIFAPRGTPVVAPQSGQVQFRGNSVGGRSFHLNSDPDANGQTNYYYGTHMDAYADPDGDGSTGETGWFHVEAGTVLGYVGDDGNAQGTGTHLHFQVHPGGPDDGSFPGTSVNPVPTLDQYCWNGARPPAAQDPAYGKV